MKSYICLLTMLFVFSAISVSAQNQTIFETDFEKNTQGWEARGTGNVSISSSKKQAATGKKSLRVIGRNANWQGTQLNVTKMLEAGRPYKFTVSVRLDKGEEPDEVKMTMQGGDSNYYGVAAKTINADEWTTFSGEFKPTGKDPYLLLYVEAGRERTSFFIDDFKIEVIAEAPPQAGVLLKNDFEDKTAQNWMVRGTGVQMFSTNIYGSQSLKVAERTENWHGLALDISPNIYKGRTYQISLSARIIPGFPEDALKIIVQQTPADGKPTYVEVVPFTKVNNSEWTTLKGTYTATTEKNNLLVLVEAETKNASFIIDNFELSVP